MLVGGVVLTLLIVLAPALQAAGGWAAPKQAPYSDVDTQPPYLVADRNHTVHALTSDAIEGSPLIVYNRWSLQSGWTAPIDILLSPIGGQAAIMGVHLDDLGSLHLVFFGGNEQGANLYYSRAMASEANRATAWSAPRVIADHVGPYVAGALSGDGSSLAVVYIGKHNQVGLYSICSQDFGKTWTEPSEMFVTSEEAAWPGAIQMTRDPQGNVHVVWTVNGDDGNGKELYYARNDRECKGWEQVSKIAVQQPRGYEVDWGSITFHDNQLFLLYNDDVSAEQHSTTRWLRRSFDYGATWTDPIRPFPNYIGENGHAVYAVDSDNVLHMLLGNRTIDSTHGMWHSIWNGSRWTDLEAVVSGPRVVAKKGENGFDPGLPKVVISQGNTILVTWATDPGAGHNGIWYSYLTLTAPALAITPLPRPTAPLSTPSTLSRASVDLVTPPAMHLTPISTRRSDQGNPIKVETQSRFDLLFLLPSALIICCVLVWKATWQSKRG